MKNLSNGNHKSKPLKVHRTDRCLQCLGPVIAGYCPTCRTQTETFTMDTAELSALHYSPKLLKELRKELS